MHCNQPFCGNGFPNGPFYSSYSTPLHSNQGIYPDIVGEGEVTSVTLPDGSVQFVFMPMLKWWTPAGAQCHPFPTIANPMFGNTNSSIPFNNTAGTWLIRRISNQLPQNAFTSSSQQNEVPRNPNNLVCNMSTHDFGYQVKFHNDNWTSTTDLVYFFPSLRQRDFVFTPPCKDKAVQINAACHHEAVCPKACICCVAAKPMSLDSLVDPKLTRKRNLVSTEDVCCEDLIKKHDKRSMECRNRRNRSKSIMCSYESAANIDYAVDKSVTTCADKGSGYTPADGRETQTYRPEESKCVGNMAIINKSAVKPKLRYCMSYSSCSTADECSSVDAVKKRQKHVRYKLNKQRKRDCGGDSTTSSVSETESMATDGCQTPFCVISKSCSKNVSQVSPSDQNTVVEWFNADEVCPQCAQESLFITLSDNADMERKFSDNSLNDNNVCDGNCNSSCR